MLNSFNGWCCSKINQLGVIIIDSSRTLLVCEDKSYMHLIGWEAVTCNMSLMSWYTAIAKWNFVLTRLKQRVTGEHNPVFALYKFSS